MAKSPSSITVEVDIRSMPDFQTRMAAARARAHWELGDESWAGIILNAFLDPEGDTEMLKFEQADRDGVHD